MPTTPPSRLFLGAIARRMFAGVSLAVACIALQASPALAHVTVWPRTAAPGGFERYVAAQVEAGVRLGDVKPVALRNERAWLERLERWG